MSPICKVVSSTLGQAAAAERIIWAKSIIQSAKKTFSDEKAKISQNSCLPDLTIVTNNNTAELRLSTALQCPPYSISDFNSQYLVRYRIPPSTIVGLEKDECMSRAERFAVASLIYGIMVDEPPFQDLSESLVQQNLEKGIYPEKTKEFPVGIALAVMSLWSQEFAQEFPCGDQSSFSAKIVSHVKAHPIQSSITAAGLVLFAGASLVNPALGFAGFSALGPTAGSAAAAWQSSIGIVQAGSLFSWCQGATMGGAAAGTIFMSQGVGGGVAGLAILKASWDGSNNEKETMQRIWSLFTEKVRKVGGKDGSEEVKT
jgi:hypothetical protein